MNGLRGSAEPLWTLLLSVLGGLVMAWVLVVVAFFIAGRRAGEPTRLRDALRLLPDVVRLVRGLADDWTCRWPRRGVYGGVRGGVVSRSAVGRSAAGVVRVAAGWLADPMVAGLG